MQAQNKSEFAHSYLHDTQNIVHIIFVEGSIKALMTVHESSPYLGKFHHVAANSL